jgi:C4-dicarboxylate transporter DctQ subunit
LKGREMIDFLSKLERIIVKFEKFIIVIFGSIMLISVTLQVFFRYVIKTSVPWTEELSIISFVILIFYGASLASYYNRHLGIKNFVNKLTVTNYKIIWYIKNIVLLLFLFYVICSILFQWQLRV